MVTIFLLLVGDYFLYFNAQWMTKKVVQMQKKKKDTFFETHFGNSKLGIDKAAKQEFSFQNEFCGTIGHRTRNSKLKKKKRSKDRVPYVRKVLRKKV